ncbi:arginine ABC transporter substrate-binding protein [Dickeya sp. CFBP 2040]|uniref:arginine ABC transporter substrate-binding protein n=1 Tax=Dickeya sp. CFBP 2040 TaxID=2718531 RepID=UPI001446C842|nr:arginine ABC transporter substrate-binding protein [Dickeya sp. CFBP 2040]NKI73069.1 arginine ABC transporter substrate-binding protein [Dickeya sp. CFBP 2040]
MKKLILAALLSTTTLSTMTFNAMAADTIRFAASATYPPFESLDASNQIVGFDIDLANALCKQLQATCSFTNQAFDSLIPALKFRRYDAIISGMDITPERSKQVAFTQPYYANSAIIIAQKGKYHTLTELKGKRIGMENGTTHQKFLQEKHPEVTTVPYDSYQNALIDLKNGRLDGVFGDTAVVNEWLKTNPDLATVGEKVTDPAYFGIGLGIAVRPDNQALLEKLNGALNAINANGTYKAINDKWFPQQ